MPKPTIQLLVCTNERPEGARKPSCGPKDALAIYRKLKDTVRARGVRDEVMVTRTGCLKHCSQGVTLCLWPRNLWYRQVTLADVEEIVDRSVVGDETIERLLMPDVPWE